MYTKYCTYFSGRTNGDHLTNETQKTDLLPHSIACGGGTVAKRSKRSEESKRNGHATRRSRDKEGFFIHDLKKQLKLF